MKGLKLGRVLVVSVLMATTVVFAGSGVAGAYEINSDYPSVFVQAGETVTFDLDVTSTRRERVELAVSSVPEGWRATLRGGGKQIGSVTTDSDVTPSVQLEVVVPADATAGAHPIVVSSSAPGQSADLGLVVNVAEEAASAFELIAEFPRLRAPADTSFQFDLTLLNNSGNDATFSLDAAGPGGWVVTARPTSEVQATTLKIDAGSTGAVQVSVDPPPAIAADTYPITVRASGEGRQLEATLEVEIVGTFELFFGTTDERLNAGGTAGRSSPINMVVRNDGSAPLTDVNLSGSLPSGWEVEFDPASIDRVEPGATTSVVARITPAGDAIAGDYAVSLTAAAAGDSQTLDVRFAVKASGFWGGVGIGVIVLALGGLLWVFRRYGRR